MANTLTGLIPVMYRGLDMVARELVGFIPAVSKDASAEQAALNQVITVPITPPASTGDITPGQLPVDDGDQTIGSTTMQITKSKYSPIRWNGEEVKGYIQNGTYQDTLAKQFAQSMRALVNMVEYDLAYAAYQGASRAYGTAGTAPFGTSGDLSDIAQIRKILQDNGAPMAEPHLVLGTSASSNIRGKQALLFKVNEAGTDDLLRRGTIGQLEGFMVGESAQVVNHTKGTGASYLTNLTGTAAIGMSSIAVDTGTGTVLAGDVVTFNGDTNKYVVGTALTGGNVVLNTPGLRQTLADGVPLTVGGSYAANVAFESEAIKLLARTPAMPEGGDLADDVMTITDPVSGLSFQVAVYKLYRRVKYEVALAWGVKVIKSDYVATLLG